MQLIHDLWERVRAASESIRAQWDGLPEVGIILGTGLSNLTEDMQVDVAIPYEEIPHFPRATVMTHKGQFVCGQLTGMQVTAMEGRFHRYEGYTMQEITFPVRVMKALGVEILIVSNASGCMNPQFRKGDIMLIEDHINLMGDNPLVGANDDRLGPRFPDMCWPYDRELLDIAERVALDQKTVVHRGVYAALIGPSLETRAEYRMLRTLGADVVGMSTVPEVIVAVHSGMRVLGLSVITDLCFPDALQPVDLDEIIAVAHEAEKRLRALVYGILPEL